MANFIDCSKNALTLEQIASMLLTSTTLAPNELAIRTMVVPACANTAINCANNGLSIETNILRAIGISSCGKPALRLGIMPADLASGLGVATYADLTAANTALASGIIFYNTALSKLDITTA